MNWKKLLTKERLKKSTITDIRNEFESDFGRIIYSPALRRMHDKTQVFPLTADDNIHSRLTHSNEVMSIGYTFGIKLSQSEYIQKATEKTELQLIRELPILLQNTCFVHDIGNAPFGHFAETLVSDYFKNIDNEKNLNFFQLSDREKRDFLFYDGNAQGLRVLTKLQYLDNPFGLNLTCATLGAYLKYPNFSLTNKEIEKALNEKGEIFNEKRIERNKHGVFLSEENFFKKIVDECELNVDGKTLRHPLCYLMEAADSIAYLCMDMEDGFNKGLYNINEIQEGFLQNGADISIQIIQICENKLLNSNSKMVSIRIKLIQYFVDLAYKNFDENLSKIENGTYNKELIEDDENKIYKILREFSKTIFKSREISYLETTGYSVFQGLLDYYIKFIFHPSPKYVNKATSLISQSIIDCAIEENLIELCEKRIKIESSNLDDQLNLFENEKEHSNYLKNEIEKLNNEIQEFEKLKKEYLKYFSSQCEKVLDKEEKDNLLSAKFKILNLKIITPQFEYLSNYYKFRVILDFISGMTDQFALNHFQKISGQKIN